MVRRLYEGNTKVIRRYLRNIYKGPQQYIFPRDCHTYEVWTIHIEWSTRHCLRRFESCRWRNLHESLCPSGQGGGLEKKKNVFSSVAVRCDFSWSHTVLHRFTKSTRKAQRHTFSMIERTKRYGNNMIIFTLTFIYLILLIFSWLRLAKCKTHLVSSTKSSRGFFFSLTLLRR